MTMNQDLLFRTPNDYSRGGGYDLSLDGRWLAYIRNGSGHWELHLIWFTEHATEREDLQYCDKQNLGDPVKDHDRWVENSPIFFIDRYLQAA